MARKVKFRPVITRVKLNPEQAVLACSCCDGRFAGDSYQNSSPMSLILVCYGKTFVPALKCDGYGALSDGWYQDYSGPSTAS